MFVDKELSSRESMPNFRIWNIDTLIEKPMKIVKIMVRKKIDFMCRQEIQ